jgi:hypothetical protein
VLNRNACILDDATVFIHRNERAVKHQQIYSYHATTSISLRNGWQRIDDNGEDKCDNDDDFF